MHKQRALASAPNHEDLFIKRYEWLLGWALKLAEQDREQAEDLLHDAYIQFTFTRPDIQAIQNVEAYLYGMLRFMRLSQIRRANRSPVRPASIVEYDSAELGLRAFDPQAQIQIQDALRRVCHYACQRKETSKAGSVLILRFFHGYYPNEIAQILKCSRPAVTKWEGIARSEARLFLTNPNALTFLQANPQTTYSQIDYTRTTKDFLFELRAAVYRSKRQDCLGSKKLESFYHSATSAGVGTDVLGHLVSCQTCLDTVNKLLDLPLLAERYPTDTLGKDMNAKGRGPRGPAGGTGGEGGSTGGPTGDGPASRRGWQRRGRQVFEHRPKELCISVNGYIQGSQKISSEVMEQSLMIDLSEPIGFVEIISEQGIRLLFQVVELPPTGPAEQQARVELSDGRTLEAALDFGGLSPTLHVVYTDPTFNHELEGCEEEVQSPTSHVKSWGGSPIVSEGLRTEVEGSTFNVQGPLARAEGLWTKVSRRWPDIGCWTLDVGLFLRPGMVTALLALVVLAGFLFMKSRGPVAPVSASDLLRRSAMVEETNAARTDQVLHRTINLEERSATGELIARRRIEVWHSADRGITARRLYDERGALISGDWRRPDGVQTLYHHGTQPKLQLTPAKRGKPALMFDTVWQLSPSAKEFSSLIDSSTEARVEERSTSYLISYSDTGGGAPGLLKASIVLSRDDLHAIEQRLLVQQGREVREFSFIEANFERRTPSAVNPTVFEPDAALLGGDVEPRSHGATENATPSPSSLASPMVATAELEVEVLGLLSQAGADMGEQVNVTRTSSGHLQVQGIVDTDQRKAEIVRALGPVIKNPAVKVEISTVAEALKRQPQTATSSGNVIVERPDTASSSLAVDSDLRRYFAGKGFSGSQLDEQIRGFASRILGHSHQALRHSWALKGLADRFSPDELRSLDSTARSKWLFMIRRHAEALQQEIFTLRRELAPVFPGGSSDEAFEEIVVGDDSDLVRAIERLFELCSEQERIVRSAFAISTDPSRAPAIRTARFWSSLKRTEKLAGKISRH